MAENKFIGARIPPDLEAAIATRMEETGQSRTDILLASLGEYLGVKTSSVEQRLSGLEAELRVVKQRLTEIEQTCSHPETPTSPTPKTGSTEGAYKVEPTKSADPGDYSISIMNLDGDVSTIIPLTPEPPAKEPEPTFDPFGDTIEGEYLTSKEAYKLARNRGYKKSFRSFVQWAPRNEEELGDLYGLVHLWTSFKGPDALKYKDVWPWDNPVSSVQVGRGYTAKELMQRFECGSKWLQDRRERYDFPELSRQRDPDAIAWEYLNGKYYPLDW